MFGEKLRENRIKNGLTQRELAERIGITQTHICLYETGKITPKMFLLRSKL